MEERQFYQLLKKYRTGNATKEEIGLLNAYYDLFDSQPDGLSNMHNKKADSIKDQIKAGVDRQLDIAEGKGRFRSSYLRIFWIAASIIVFATTTAVFFYKKFQRQPLSEKYASYDVKPAKKNVTLTLANGSKIIIHPATMGQVAMQGNTTLSQQSSGVLVYAATGKPADQVTQYNTISIPDGTQFEVILPDGSKAFLNANSSLKYPTVFNEGLRQVELQGEAYFEVAHNKAKPFIVRTANQAVVVLGTHFNVNAYADERTTKTTLLQGRVQVLAGTQELMLLPGQQAQVINNAALLNGGTVAPADTDQAIAWKNGFFQYHEADIKAIMRDFSRWYGVKVIYNGNIHERLFSGAIHKNLSLLQALDLLNYANVSFTIENKQITISNN